MDSIEGGKSPQTNEGRRSTASGPAAKKAKVKTFGPKSIGIISKKNIHELVNKHSNAVEEYEQWANEKNVRLQPKEQKENHYFHVASFGIPET